MLQCILAAVFFTMQNLSNKLFSHHFKSGLYPLAVLNGMALTMGTVALAVLCRPSAISPTAMLFAALFGLLFNVTISMIVLTLKRGPLGMSNLIINMSVVVLILFGALVWKEPVTLLRGIALVLLLIVLVMLALPEKGQKEDKRGRLSWLLTALSTMLLNGAVVLIPKTALTFCPDLLPIDFTFWSILCGAVICAAAAIVMHVFFKARFAEGEPVRRLPAIAAGLGIGTAAAFYFQNDALTSMDSIMVYPVVVGLNVALLMITSILFFGERLSLRKGIAFLLGMAGILMMNF